MIIKAIYEVASNRDRFNFRIKSYDADAPKEERVWEVINIKTYNSCKDATEFHKEIKNGFKYWYNPQTRERKHHKGITTSFQHSF